MPESEIQLIARALLTAYGTGAETKANECANNVRQLDMPERLAWWNRVIAAIKNIQAETG